MPLLATYDSSAFQKYNVSGPSSAGTPTAIYGPGGAIPTALPAGLVSGGLLAVQAVYNLTSANLLALPGTKIQLVTTPGSNLALVPNAMTLQYKFGGTAFTIANADNAFQVEYTGQATNLLKANATGLVDQAVNTIISAWPTVTGTDITQTTEANLGLELTLVGTTPALTLGNGSVILTLRYWVVVLQ